VKMARTRFLVWLPLETQRMKTILIVATTRGEIRLRKVVERSIDIAGSDSILRLKPFRSPYLAPRVVVTINMVSLRWSKRSHTRNRCRAHFSRTFRIRACRGIRTRGRATIASPSPVPAFLS